MSTICRSTWRSTSRTPPWSRNRYRTLCKQYAVIDQACHIRTDPNKYSFVIISHLRADDWLLTYTYNKLKFPYVVLKKIVIHEHNVSVLLKTKNKLIKLLPVCSSACEDGWTELKRERVNTRGNIVCNLFFLFPRWRNCGIYYINIEVFYAFVITSLLQGWFKLECLRTN